MPSVETFCRTPSVVVEYYGGGESFRLRTVEVILDAFETSGRCRVVMDGCGWVIDETRTLVADGWYPNEKKGRKKSRQPYSSESGQVWQRYSRCQWSKGGSWSMYGSVWKVLETCYIHLSGFLIGLAWLWRGVSIIECPGPYGVRVTTNIGHYEHRYEHRWFRRVTLASGHTFPSLSLRLRATRPPACECRLFAVSTTATKEGYAPMSGQEIVAGNVKPSGNHQKTAAIIKRLPTGTSIKM